MMLTNIALKNPSITQEIYNPIPTIVPYDDIEQAHIRDTLSWIESGAPIFRVKKPDVPNKLLSKTKQESPEDQPLWRKHNVDWKILYHQGTLIEGGGI